MTVHRIIVATGNPGKLIEIRRMLDIPGLEVIAPADIALALDVEETGTTYAENAALKAEAFAAAAGCMALADDSGIEVDALDGRPGVYSARYGGPELDDDGRNRLLLEELKDVPSGWRNARYRAVVAIAGAGMETQLFDGVLEGYIAAAPRGTGGFGYDPLMVIDSERTVAELDAETKDAVSHRGKALRKARAWLDAYLRAS